MSDPQQDKSLFSLVQIQHLMRVEFNRAQRYSYPVACLLVSVDRLGHLRDLYGYESKEEIFEAVVEMLKIKTRCSDFLGRMADDRLLAVVPHTDGEGATVLANRLLDGARNMTFTADGRTIQVTVSVGVSHNGGGTALFFDAMFLAAEEALAAASSVGDCMQLLDPGGIPAE
jgi:diguanylate cyclase (GGDEF)-like protein